MKEAAHDLRFGPFELLEPLGGGMGIVYRARRAGADRDVALKLLRQERLLGGEARARFARELGVMQRLSHPGICPVLEAGEIDGMPYLCMPVLSGRSLDAYLGAAREQGVGAQVRLPGGEAQAPAWARVVHVAAKVADTLQAVHDHGFVHRDVKPANLWIDPQGEPVLLDFGLARDGADRYAHLTRTGQIVGTPTYLAPEQIDARLGPVDARADVYGLGAVLYETLTLTPPFSGSTRAELYARILAGQPADVRRYAPRLPEALAVVLEVAMARHPRERYPTAAALAEDLRRTLRNEPILARQRPLLLRAVRWAGRRPLPMAMAGVLMLTLCLCLGPLVRLAHAADLAAAERAERDHRTWPGRLALAVREFDLLPPPRPRHRGVLAAWLRDHGEPLLRAPGDVDVPGLHPFATAAVADVRDWLHWVDAVQARGGDVGLWSAAQAGVAADARFRGFELMPQFGLVPLGADPKSHLEEFYDLASGDPALAVPERDANRSLQLAEAHGIVLVLLPGGSYRLLGSGPTTSLLPPFLLAKHELTRAQHARLDCGNDPSYEALGLVEHLGERQTGRHPVNHVRYLEVWARLRRWGFDLPTVLEWEYAARADRVGDVSDAPGNYSSGDPFRGTAPVGSFDANGFGLHDVLGNVRELCADPGDARWLASSPSEETGRLRCRLRGGCYGSGRWPFSGQTEAWADQREKSVGVRALRRLDPP